MQNGHRMHNTSHQHRPTATVPPQTHSVSAGVSTSSANNAAWSTQHDEFDYGASNWTAEGIPQQQPRPLSRTRLRTAGASNNIDTMPSYGRVQQMPPRRSGRARAATDLMHEDQFNVSLPAEYGTRVSLSTQHRDRRRQQGATPSMSTATSSGSCTALAQVGYSDDEEQHSSAQLDVVSARVQQRTLSNLQDRMHMLEEQLARGQQPVGYGYLPQQGYAPLPSSQSMSEGLARAALPLMAEEDSSLLAEECRRKVKAWKAAYNKKVEENDLRAQAFAEKYKKLKERSKFRIGELEHALDEADMKNEALRATMNVQEKELRDLQLSREKMEKEMEKTMLARKPSNTGSTTVTDEEGAVSSGSGSGRSRTSRMQKELPPLLNQVSADIARCAYTAKALRSICDKLTKGDAQGLRLSHVLNLPSTGTSMSEMSESEAEHDSPQTVGPEGMFNQARLMSNKIQLLQRDLAALHEFAQDRVASSMADGLQQCHVQ